MLKEVSSGAIAYLVGNEAVVTGRSVSQGAAEGPPGVGKSAGDDSGGGAENSPGNGIARPRILMIYDASGRWTFPKGLVERGESLEEAALRELREETGVNGAIEHGLGSVHYFYHGTGGDLISKTVHYFLVRSVPSDPVPLLSEIRDARWVGLAEARRLNGYRNNIEVLNRAIDIIEGFAESPTGDCRSVARE